MGACTSKCTRGVQESDFAYPASCAVGVTSEKDLNLAAEPTPLSSKSMVEERNSVEQQIERSKCHWSEVLTVKLSSVTEDGLETGVADVEDEEEMARVKADNEQVFRDLQQHPTWGDFFLTFGEGSGRSLKVGEKFAEGGQAELFHAHITWRNPKNNEKDREKGREWIVKVFKKGTLLRQLQHQWPLGYLRYRADLWEQHKLGIPPPFRHTCLVYGGTLLGDGRFAFVMRRDQEDLRTRIDRHMTMRTGQHSGPFSEKTSKWMMYNIALGMEWLHSRDIVHRDLKASNVLFSATEKHWGCYVADFECSVGVVGTKFWRAPEILQACREGSIHQRPELFTKAADVYSYSMTCYEILTGKLPFEGQSVSFDDVVSGQRPQVPEYVEADICRLLEKCWQSNPAYRPSFSQIMQEPLFNQMRIKSAKWQVNS